MQNKLFYKGISINSCQKNIQFPMVARAGIDIIYIRTGVGNNYTDPCFKYHYQSAQRGGWLVGLFHDSIARSPQEAVTEARFFTSLAGGLTPDCRLVMGYEYFRGLNLADINNIALAFLKSTAELSHKEVMLYSDTYNATLTFDEEATSYPLWVAQYGVPAPSTKIRWSNWDGFEYSDNATIPGIAQGVRRSFFRPSVLLQDKTPIPARPIQRFHTVQNGETLWWIAHQTGAEVEQLAELNRIHKSHQLPEGTILKLPATLPEKTRRYIVKEGDNLWNIANRIHTTVARLVTINKIKLPYLIQTGQTLLY